MSNYKQRKDEEYLNRECRPDVLDSIARNFLRTGKVNPEVLANYGIKLAEHIGNNGYLKDRDSRISFVSGISDLVNANPENRSALNFAQETFRRLDYLKKHGLELSLQEQGEILRRQDEFQQQFGKVNNLEGMLHVYNEADQPVLYIAKDVERNSNGTVMEGRTDLGIAHFDGSNGKLA